MKLAFIVGILLIARFVAVAQDPSSVDPAETVVTSDELELVGGDTQNKFFFSGRVKVTATNLVATCDYMEITAARSGATAPTIGEMGAIQSILMKGNVVIEQAGRRATAGQAEILPDQDKVVLTENPVVIDSQGTVTGHRMELLKGERKAKVFGDPATGGRTRVTLPGFKDLGFEDPGETSFRQPRRTD